MELGGRFILPQWSVGLVRRELKTELDQEMVLGIGIVFKNGLCESNES